MSGLNGHHEKGGLAVPNRLAVMVIDLLGPDVAEHRNPENANYHGCDKTPCEFCRGAKALFEEVCPLRAADGLRPAVSEDDAKLALRVALLEQDLATVRVMAMKGASIGDVVKFLDTPRA